MTWSGILFELLCDLSVFLAFLFVCLVFSFFLFFWSCFIFAFVSFLVCVCLVVLISMDIGRKFSGL